MTEKMMQDYLRTLLLLLEQGKIDEVKECLRLST
jgi:hypothetical protein